MLCQAANEFNNCTKLFRKILQTLQTIKKSSATN